MIAMLEIKHLFISKQGQVLVNDLKFKTAAGDFLSLMGPSGSGKSTILSWIVGSLDEAFQAEGELWINGQRRDALAISARRVGVLFQDDLLFPHLSVGQNLAFALPASIAGRSARRLHIEQTLIDIGLAGFHDRDPASLSGGQRARVGLLRALLAEPDVLLLDEPFSKLDAVLREQFRLFVFDRVRKMKIPALLVTHDIADIPAAGAVLDMGEHQAHR
jgi:putative thiamine transport system ATP-binding protein